MPSKGGDGACSHLISTSEAEFASMFIKLMDDADCRSLYGRLIFRKGNVFRRSEILSKYGAQMDKAISALVDIGLIDLPLMASGSATAEEISQDVIFARNGCSSNLARKQTLLALLQRVTAGAGRKAMPRDAILQKIKTAWLVRGLSLCNGKVCTASQLCPFERGCRWSRRQRIGEAPQRAARVFACLIGCFHYHGNVK